MTLELLGLDYEAQQLVLRYRDTEAINQAHKMRSAVAYGLERFWGERLRLKEQDAEYWRDVWQTICRLLADSGINLPDPNADINNTAGIQEVTQVLWNFPMDQRKVALAILLQFCDCLVWWTQRYKPRNQRG